MKKGTTILELLIAIIILGIMMTVFSAIYINGVTSFRNEFTTSQLQSTAQTVVDRINQDIKSARGTESTYENYTLSDNTLILRLPAISNDDQEYFIYSGGMLQFDTYIYYLSENEIQRIIYANPSSKRYSKNEQVQTLTKNVTELVFSYDPDITSPVRISTTITLSRDIGKLTRQAQVTATAKMRNNL